MERLQYYFTEFELFKIQDVGITISHLWWRWWRLLRRLCSPG